MIYQVTPFEVYQKYLSLKQHFNREEYDYFKFRGKVRANESSFEKRKDKHHFVRLSKIYKDEELTKFLVSNFVKTKSAGYLSHSEAISFMKSSHLLVNFNYHGTNKPDMISGKLIEYLATGSPIINISHTNSESESLISLSEDSVTASQHDLDKIVSYISKRYINWFKGEFKEKIPNNIDEYSRLNLTKKLAIILGEI